MERAKRATITIGEIVVEVFKTGGNSFVLSQVQASEAIGMKQNDITSFCRTKAAKALLGKDYTLRRIEAEGAATGFIAPVPIEVTQAFWLREATKKQNVKAIALIAALMTETLQRKCENAFSTGKETAADIAKREAAIARKAVEAYRRTLFGGGNLNNEDYQVGCKETREDHKDCAIGL